MLHWNGTAWTLVHLPVVPGGALLTGVFAASGRNAWAVGCTGTCGAAARPLVLHWNGRAWKRTPVT
jgi:hypothetical protein